MVVIKFSQQNYADEFFIRVNGKVSLAGWLAG
jgi:hypothetical protein